MWELESAAPPADPEARQIQVTLAQSRARYVSPDLEFAVWAATIGEGREGEPVTVVGPLGHVTAGGVNGLCRRFLRVSRQRFAPPAGSLLPLLVPAFRRPARAAAGSRRSAAAAAGRIVVVSWPKESGFASLAGCQGRGRLPAGGPEGRSAGRLAEPGNLQR
jgi:hypothetical protein